jgi:hypothetical protein
MNGKLAKKLKRLARRGDIEIAYQFKAWVNGLSFGERLKVCFRILRRCL